MLTWNEENFLESPRALSTRALGSRRTSPRTAQDYPLTSVQPLLNENKKIHMKDSGCIVLGFRGFGLTTIQRFRPGDFCGGLEDVGDEGAELGGADGLVHVAVE